MRKIMFNDKYGLTRAVLEGRKTMTRRIEGVEDTLFDVQLERLDSKRRVGHKGKEYFRAFYETGGTVDYYPRYKVGETVAIAQSYADLAEQYPHSMVIGAYNCTAGRRNKLYVAACAMPHRIRITNVTVERLQDISDEDCMKEGIEKVTDDWWTYDKNSSLPFDKVTFRTPREAFAALIDKISGKGTWNRNPFVFVYEFELNNDTARHCGKEHHERTENNKHQTNRT